MADERGGRSLRTPRDVPALGRTLVRARLRTPDVTSTVATGSTSRVGVLRNGLSVAWGAVSGVAPHVLHHVGPLAGAALLAGAAGRILFFVLGLLAAIPMLIRLYRRFRSWAAPAIAVTLFAVTYTVSSIYVGPLFAGTEPTTDPPASSVTTTTHAHDH